MVELDRRTLLTALGVAGTVPIIGAAASCTPTTPPIPLDLTWLVSSELRRELESFADDREMTPAEAAVWRCGVNAFDFNAGPSLPPPADVGHGALRRYMDGLLDGPPGVVRWTVSWDRYDRSPTARQDWQDYVALFDDCAASRIRLILNVWVKSPQWWGDDAFGPGCSWAKPGGSTSWNNYPEDPRGSYGQFLKDLYRAARTRYEAAGSDPGLVCIEAWNEPDILWGSDLGSNPVSVINPSTAWSVRFPWSWAYFSGGTDGFAELHRVLDDPWTDDPPPNAAPAYPDAPWHSGGIGSTGLIQFSSPPAGWASNVRAVDLSRDADGLPVHPADTSGISPWITDSLSAGRISEIDIHFYMNNLRGYPSGSSSPIGRAEHIVFGVERCLWVWDSAAAGLGLPAEDPRRRLPFYLGETGRDSGTDRGHLTPEAARELRIAHWYFATAPHLADRYRGMAALGSGVTYLESSHGWWHPGYDDFAGEP